MARTALNYTVIPVLICVLLLGCSINPSEDEATGDRDVQEQSDSSTTDNDLEEVVLDSDSDSDFDLETDVPESEFADGDDDPIEIAEETDSVDEDLEPGETDESAEGVEEDATQPTACAPEWKSQLGGVPMDFVIRGDRLYVARGAGGLQIFDIETPSDPVRIGLYRPSFGEALHLHLVDDTVYLAEYDWDLTGAVSGLEILDVSDPTAPVLIGGLQTNRNRPYNYVRAFGDVVYLTGESEGLEVVDITDPSNPSIVTTLELSRSPGKIEIGENVMFIADSLAYNGAINALDISNPRSPFVLSTFTQRNSTPGIALDGGRLFVAAGWDGLVVLDVSDTASMEITVDYPFDQDYWFGDVNLDEGILFAATNSGVLAFSIEDDLINLENLSSMNVSAAASDMEGDLLAIMHRSGYGDRTNYRGGIKLLRISEENPPEFQGEIARLDGWMRIARWRNHLYITEADCPINLQQICGGGLRVFDISDPSKPVRVASVETSGARDVVVDGEYAYIADGYQGVLIYDISDPVEPQLVAQDNTYGQTYGLAKKGERLYVADGEQGLLVIDVEDPENWREISRNRFSFSVTDVDGLGPYALAISGAFLWVLDTDDIVDGQAALISETQMYGSLQRITVKDGRAYIATLGWDLLIVDLTDLEHPAIESTFRLETEALAADVLGDIVYVANNMGGMTLVDVSDSQNPQEVSNYDTRGFTSDVHVSLGYAYIGDDDGGLIVTETHCHCAPGYIGSRCQYCDTESGYSMREDGFTCFDDPCLPNPCQEPHETVCSETLLGDAACSCDTEYLDYGDDECRPADPCSVDDSCTEAHRYCTGSEGFVVCGGCMPGYHDESGSCVLDTYCLTTTCSRHGECTDLGDSIECACDTGYREPFCDACDEEDGWHLSGDGVTCTRDLCDPDPCSMRGRCVPDNGTCVCEVRFTGDHCESCTDPTQNYPYCYGEEDLTEGYVAIPRGTFVMGSPYTEPFRYNTDPEIERQHHVTLTRDFELSQYELTQSGFGSVTHWNPSQFTSCGGDCPVEDLSWYDMAAYMNLLSIQAGLPTCFAFSDINCDDGTFMGGDYTGCMTSARNGIFTANVYLNGISSIYDCQGYRFPTEAEWEYAARAGTVAPFYSGGIEEGVCEEPNLEDFAWYCGNSINTPHPVGEKAPNPWGLFDILGNVYEWTWDPYVHYLEDAVDPEGAGGSSNRVVRGGSYSNYSAECRSAARSARHPTQGFYENLGLRPARTLKSPSPLCSPDPCNGHGVCDDEDGSCTCLQNFTGEGCDECAQGYGNYPTCYNIPGIPIMSIDCINGYNCMAQTSYQVSFNHQYADRWSASLEVVSGTGTTGTVSPSSGTITNSNTVHFGYTAPARVSNGHSVRITVTVYGLGGETSSSLQVLIQ